MQFALVSDDPDIVGLCREVLAEMPGRRCSLVHSGVSAPTRAADVYIWDVCSDIPPAATFPAQDYRGHYFLVNRADLPRFRKALPHTPNVLLKPVTKAVLLAFLGSACDRVHTVEPACVNGAPADRNRILQHLLETNLKLQEYDQERTNFLARAIHDFRAPLTALTGYCGLLLSEDFGSVSEQQRYVLERMHRSAVRLSRMADAMFQLSICARVERRPDIQPAEIGDAVQQAVHEVLPAAQERQLTLRVNMCPVGTELCFDPTAIEQVLVNLLENACKFTPRGGSIQIAGYPWCWENAPHRRVHADRVGFNSAGPNSYRVNVIDSGPGIPPAHISGVFDEYTSLNGGDNRPGGGLGLAICRMILRQHQGCIWAESRTSGAVFSFVLPFHNTRSGSEQHGRDRSSLSAYAVHHS